MDYFKLRPGLKVRCVSATYGYGIQCMQDLIGKIVTIHNANDKLVEIEECYNEDSDYYFAWAPVDFEPYYDDLGLVSEDDLQLLIGIV